MTKMVKQSSRRRRPANLEEASAITLGIENSNAAEDVDEHETYLAYLRSAIPAPPPAWDDDVGMAKWLDAMLKVESYEAAAREHEVRDWSPPPDDYAISQALEHNYEPLWTLLETGASHFLQKWIARYGRAGGFAARKKPSDKSDLLAAAEDVPRIRRLWRDHYKRLHRVDLHGVKHKTAVQFAAERHGVSEDDLTVHLKHRTKKTA